MRRTPGRPRRINHAAVLELVAAGWSYPCAAEVVGCSPIHVYRIVRAARAAASTEQLLIAATQAA